MINKVEVRRALFNPKAVAVVGASPHPKKLGNFVLRSIKTSKVEKIYAVRPGNNQTILGIDTYPSIDSLPEENIDLFLFCVPQKAILDSLEQAIKKGCKGAVIYAGGFKESGETGLKLQREIQTLANQANIGIIGPNTLGYFRANTNINATFMPVFSDMFPEIGHLSIVSQSGGVAGQIAIKIFESSIPLGTLICLGNRANIDFHHVLDFLAEDEQTSIIGLFVEGIDDVRSFYASAQKCAIKKPIVILSAGHSEAGKRAARSHTGSMVTSPDIYKGMFKQAGLLQVWSVQELVDTLKALHFKCEINGNGAAVITHTAGPAIIATDALTGGKFNLSEFTRKTKQKLKESGAIPGFIQLQNPVDMASSGYLDRIRYLDVIDILQRDPNTDVILPICMSPLSDPNLEVFPFEEMEARKKNWNKPVIFAWLGIENNKEELDKWNKVGIPTYPCPARAAQVATNLLELSKLRKKLREKPSEAKTFPAEIGQLLKEFIDGSRDYLGEIESKEILKLLGIQTVETVLATSPTEAVEAASKIGFPVAMKIVDTNIIHKSAKGGVRLNIGSSEEVIKTLQHFRAIGTPKGFKGASIQPQIPKGLEIIVGAADDNAAGPAVMVGLGGIYVEAIKDVVFRLAPIDETTAMEMIHDLKSFPGIKRINPDLDLTSLSEILCKISHLIYEYPIKEIDLNPIIFYDSKYSVVDARMTLKIRPAQAKH